MVYFIMSAAQQHARSPRNGGVAEYGLGLTSSLSFLFIRNLTGERSPTTSASGRRRRHARPLWV